MSKQTEIFNTVPEHNGYTNKPTWAVCLWINNDESLQSQVLALAAGNDKYNVSQLIEHLFTDTYYPLDKASVYMDLLNWALAYVDWIEVAEHFIESAKELPN